VFGGPLLGAVAHAVQHGLPRFRRGVLGFQQVDLGSGKIVESSGVIEIEVGEHDMSNVRGLKTEARNLAHRGHLLP
jgi:hypothetical protein